CDAPTLSPTSSTFFGCFRLLRFEGVAAAGLVPPFFGRLKRSESLISLFRSTIASAIPHPRGEVQTDRACPREACSRTPPARVSRAADPASRCGQRLPLV